MFCDCSLSWLKPWQTIALESGEIRRSKESEPRSVHRDLPLVPETDRVAYEETVINWWRLRVSWHDREREKLLGTTVLEDPTFLWTWLLGNFQVLHEDQKKIPSWLWQGKGKVIIVKYAPSVLHNKGLLSRRKDFARASSPLGKNILPTLGSLLSLSHPREQSTGVKSQEKK